jgi:hypothetical protein
VPPLEGKERLPMDESIVEFVKSVRIESCRVINTPRLVFLCGGATADSKTAPVLSARDYFYRYIKSNEPNLLKRVRLAEEINDWFDEDTFADLLELEAYLADSSDLTILFVESPGSIAELGAFAATEVLCSRTLAILNDSHKSIRTFIADGPVRRIKKCDENLVRYFEWNDENPADSSNDDVFQDMSKELIQSVADRSTPKERIIDRVSNGHTMFLIADLVDVIGITSATEIIECLSLWGYSIDPKKLKKYLSLLEHLVLIKQKRYSDQIYYLSGASAPLIRYDFVPGTKLRDRDRIKSLVRATLFRSDQRRMKVYQRELKRPSKGKRPHV